MRCETKGIMSTDPAAGAPYVSTGQLPPTEHVRRLVNETYERFRANADGALSRVYPSLATVDPDRFGICVMSIRGLTATAGDADAEFSIMSVAKPFVFALMCSRARSRHGGSVRGSQRHG